MLEKHFGDSYDIVKRFWFDELSCIAPLFSHPRFVNKHIRGQYMRVTTIPILDDNGPPDQKFGLLFDPHTGIPLADKLDAKTTPSHAALSYIVGECDRLRPDYMICFDQTHHRKHELNGANQRLAKRRYLQEHNIASFYYLSHASFLFMAKSVTMLEVVRTRLLDKGIPETCAGKTRLQQIEIGD